MIDLIKAKETFEKYSSKYDLTSEKINRKIKHTYRTSDISNMIAKGINLDEEDIELATLIGLLHDIGRFEQCKRYETFSDQDSLDHGELGVKVLLENNLIRDFIEETTYDNIIIKAIFNHNKYKMQEGLEGKELLHSKIIRDADKLDDLYLGTTSVHNYDENELISDIVFNNFLNNECIVYNSCNTNIDKRLTYLGWIYDINFEFSLKYIKEKDYINQIIDNMSCENEDTRNKMKIIKKATEDFLNK